MNRTLRRSPKALLAAALPLAALLAWSPARADAVDTLRAFVRDVKSGSASFTQTVTSPDGAKKKTCNGSFEFARPTRFRFVYAKPFEQVIVADGQKVWIYDADLNQASSRKFSQALGATPAALLAGGSLEKDFVLRALPARGGLEWAEAVPRDKEGGFKSLEIGFRGKDLAAFDIVDAFGQKSSLTFSGMTPNVVLPPERFVFTVPKGADLLEQ